MSAKIKAVPARFGAVGDGFKCPSCGAVPGKCGKGECHYYRHGSSERGCQGIICECEDESDYEIETHGESEERPCENAVCYHCDWSGRLPQLAFALEKLKGWARKAWDAGWKPPKGWTPS